MNKKKAALIWALLGTGFLVYGLYCALTTGGTWYLVASAVILIASGAVCLGSTVQIMRRPVQQGY
ncbi:MULTISPECIES: hypothetical protein [Micrococcaceae]|uniref:hypothetical protein n=1 Tax=Micrococcaceae TaxID=1268 RepID=UPI001E535CEE|nr:MULTISPECIES: hypothetical protein [Micrococcaceae]MCD4850729.1 hypothetical protein [Arthrobacter sp. AK01]MCP1415693.1 hypothetical protein [Paenarthrobacter sp. A20]